jgi:4'-phosphopantetheinyl transferase EntD
MLRLANRLSLLSPPEEIGKQFDAYVGALRAEARAWRKLGVDLERHDMVAAKRDVTPDYVVAHEVDQLAASIGLVGC